MNDKINFNNGALELVKIMNKHHGKTVIISGGFLPVIEHVANKLNFDFFHGNEFDYYINEKGEKALNGKVKKPILDKSSKLYFQQLYKNKFKLSKDDIISVGDGANDLDIIKEAGIGVAYKAKPILKRKADIVFDYTNLKGLLYVQGYKKSEIDKII